MGLNSVTILRTIDRMLYDTKMKVSEVTIDDDFITVNGKDTVLDVAKAISKAGIPDAIVLDDDQKVLGALDDYDIISKAIAPEKDIKSLTAKEIMYAPPLVKKDTELEKAREIMEKLEATVLPVVDNDQNLLGVLTIMDVFEGLALENEQQSKKGFLSRILG